MKRIARMVIVLIGLGACAMGMTMLGTAPTYTQQGAPQFDVNVVNSSTNPVPVQDINYRNLITTSDRAVLFAGDTFQTASLYVPSCSPGTKFMVTNVQVGLETLGGSTASDVVTLGKWAVNVGTRQEFSSGAGGLAGSVPVGLVVMGDGPQHASASIPAGQSVLLPGGALDVVVKLLGGTTAAGRYEFLIHVTGGCGTPFVGAV